MKCTIHSSSQVLRWDAYNLLQALVDAAGPIPHPAGQDDAVRHLCAMELASCDRDQVEATETGRQFIQVFGHAPSGRVDQAMRDMGTDATARFA